MTLVRLIARPCLVHPHAGEKMPRNAGDRLAVIRDQSEGSIAFGLVEITDLLVADELQLRMVESEFVHDRQSMCKVAADPVCDNSEFHEPSPPFIVSIRYRQCPP